MGKWPLVRLGDVCEFLNGGTPSKKEPRFYCGSIPWITSTDIVSDEVKNARSYITEEAVNKSATKLVKKGTILLVSRTGVGKIAIAGMDLCFSQDITGIIPNESVIDRKYLYYCLRFNTDYFSSLQRGATIKGITRNVIESLNIPLPPIDSQKHIANTLDKTQEIIDSYKKQLAELDNLIRAVFYEMFGDPVTNEKGLKAAKIKDFFVVKSGSTPNRNRNEYWKDGTIPWIKTTEIKENHIYSSEEYITELAAKECRLTRMPKGTILVAMYGQGQTRGRTAKLMVDATINQACAALVKKKDNINVDFVWHFLMISYEQLRSLGRGGNQPNLNKSLVENFEILIPDISFQTKFADIVTKIEEQKALVKQAITESEHLFNSLMSKYFD